MFRLRKLWQVTHTHTHTHTHSLSLALQSVEADNVLSAVLEAFRVHTSAMIEVRDILHVMDSRRTSSRLSVYDLGLSLFVKKDLMKPPLDSRVRTFVHFFIFLCVADVHTESETKSFALC